MIPKPQIILIPGLQNDSDLCGWGCQTNSGKSRQRQWP